MLSRVGEDLSPVERDPERRNEIAGNFLQKKRTLPAACLRVGVAMTCFHAGCRLSEPGKQLDSIHQTRY
jgi:hypothetical protein